MVSSTTDKPHFDSPHSVRLTSNLQSVAFNADFLRRFGSYTSAWTCRWMTANLIRGGVEVENHVHMYCLATNLH